MSQLQSIVMLLALLALALAPVVYRWAQRKDQADAATRREARRLPDVMTGRQAAGRHLFGETYSWVPWYMDSYDSNPELRQYWEHAAVLRAGKLGDGRPTAAG